MHRQNHEEQEAVQPQPARRRGCGPAQLEVPAFVGHDQEAHRRTYRTRVHRKIRIRQKYLFLLGLKITIKRKKYIYGYMAEQKVENVCLKC